ncbi:Hypothetical protein PSEBR_cmegm128 [Pseudomonas brassicacearum subsp. brassicacearum NFM421]|uniref:MAE-28990/MAE-18760-like HEPN domain-containing protein n=1 Tax=Pseudomonas brassicacearum (strain NFM421) TaxID=994484 RepID=F2KM83_PSEBN|nr:hypothetical protein [Pseudomonas brassicacearum]AEA71626.1 Hypothetical protein PSEBR_cmegm128 [Pseudomonas brassicacearum subsp. brassicacearum NFM421]
MEDDLVKIWTRNILARAKMSVRERCEHDIIGILNSALREWIDIGDFVWKSDHVITREKEIEQKKIKSYFPDKDAAKDVIAARAEILQNRLENTYPYMISSGNLFSILSIFEAYLLRLARSTEDFFGADFKTTKGNGCDKIFNYFRAIDIAPEKISLHEQIKCAQKIRNCLTHAGGLLQLYRDADSLEKLVADQAYLSSNDRKRRAANSSPMELVSIGDYYIGQKVTITHHYPHLLTNYLSEYIQSIGSEILQQMELR